MGKDIVIHYTCFLDVSNMYGIQILLCENDLILMIPVQTNV